MHRFHVLAPVLCVALALSCRSQPGPSGPAEQASDLSLVPSARAASVPPPAAKLDPARGAEVGLEAEAFLSPHQEPEEETSIPRRTPEQFRSTAPSKSRSER